MAKNENESGIIFRKKFGGYNRDDVNSYISSMNANFSSLEESYKSMINQLKAECDRLEKECLEAKEEKASFENDNIDLKAKVEALTAQNDELAEKIAQKDEQLTALSREKRSFIQKFEELRTKVADFSARSARASADFVSKAQEVSDGQTNPKEDNAKIGGISRDFAKIAGAGLTPAEKARFFDKFCLKFREILLDARLSADRIVKEAKGKAQSLEKEAQKAYSRVKEKTLDKISGENELSGFAGDVGADIDKALEELSKIDFGDDSL